MEICGSARTGRLARCLVEMPFAARALRDEARRYRELKRAINCPRTLTLLDQMATDLEGKAEVIEANAARPPSADKGRETD